MAVYLDCAATAPIEPRVRDLVLRCFGPEFGNAASRTHAFGARARSAVERARDQIAAALNAGRGEVFFTSGATESCNLAILGLAEHGTAAGRTHVVATQIEHRAVLEPLQALLRRGFQVTLVPPTPGGWVDPGAVRAAVRDETLLVSVMQVNNETGVRQPLEEIAESLDDHPAFLHVDAAQGFGKENGPLRHARIDLVSISGHKIHGPAGVGALAARRRAGRRPPLQPLVYGGGHELGLRPGTLPMPLIAGFGLAAELAEAEAGSRAAACAAFKQRLMEALRPLEPVVNGDPVRTVPNMINLSFPGIEAEEALEALGGLVAVSDGAACTAHSETCSHVLAAMRVPPQSAAGALRFSWSHLTEEPDWDAVVRTVSALRRLS